MTLLALAGLFLAPPAVAQLFAPINPDTTGLVSSGKVNALTSNGRSAGSAGFPTGSRAVYWDETGTHELPVLVGDDVGFGADMNAAGTVVGASVDNVQQGSLLLTYSHAAVWIAGVPGNLNQLKTGGDDVEMRDCDAIDAAGRIIGTGFGPTDCSYLFDNGIVTRIDDPTLTYSRFDAVGFGPGGEILGAAVQPGQFHAATWLNGFITDLHDPAQIAGQQSHARASNAAGVVVGSARFDAGPSSETAAMWKNNVITNLGTLPGPGIFKWSTANAVNIHEQVVGNTYVNLAFLWENGELHNLNTLLPTGSPWTLNTATDIDDDGRICGEGTYGGAGPKPYILLPDCDGTYTVLPGGCVGAGNYMPQLAGVECPGPGPGGSLKLRITQGFATGSGWLVFGTGNGALPLTGSCSIGIAPLAPGVLFPFQLGGVGIGGGWKQFAFTVAPGMGGFDVWSQAVLIDAGAPSFVAATNPLRVSVP